MFLQLFVCLFLINASFSAYMLPSQFLDYAYRGLPSTGFGVEKRSPALTWSSRARMSRWVPSSARDWN